MGRLARRSVFAATVCAGVTMVGASVHGLMDVDAQLQRSAMAARQQQQQVKSVSFTVFSREPHPDCQGWPAPPPPTRERA